MKPRAGALALALAACGPSAPPNTAVEDTSPVVARVGDEVVRAAEVTATARALGLEARPALERAIETRLLAQEARRRGLDVPWARDSAAWQARVQLLLQRSVEARFAPASVPRPLIDQMLAARAIELSPGERMVAAHFLARLPEHPTEAQETAARTLAETFRTRLLAVASNPDRAQFEAASRGLPAGETRLEDLAPFDREGHFDGPGFEPGAYVPEFVRGAWALTPEAPVSPPVRSPFGYHVILRREVLPAAPRPAAEQEAIVRQDVAAEARVRALQELLERVRVRRPHHLSPEALRRAEGGGP